VFDYDPTIETKAKRDLRDAFEAMQEVVLEFRATHPVASPAPAPAAAQPKKAPAASGRQSPVKDPKAELEDELTVALREARRRFEEHAPLTDDEDFEVLVQARFAPELEQAALGLLELAWRGKVVPSRDELSRIDIQRHHGAHPRWPQRGRARRPRSRRCSTCVRCRASSIGSPRCRETYCPSLRRSCVARCCGSRKKQVRVEPVDQRRRDRGVGERRPRAP
jgi:hypothetical protein